MLNRVPLSGNQKRPDSRLSQRILAITEKSKEAFDKNSNRKFSGLSFSYLLGVLSLALLLSTEAFAQTTIISGSTVNASTITANTAIIINAGGTLNMDVAKQFTTVTTANAGTSTITGSNLLTLTGAVTIAGGNTLQNSNSGGLSGVSLTHSGTGTATLSGSNTFTLSGAVTLISGQTLALNSNVSAASLSTATLNNTTATLSGTGSLTLSGAITINGTTGNPATLAIGSNSTVISTNTVTSIATGTGSNATTYTLSNSGTIKISGAIATGASGLDVLTSTAVGSTFDYAGAAQNVFSTNYYNLTLSGSGLKTLQGGTTTISGNLTLSGSASTATVAALSITGNLSIGNGTTFTATAFSLTVTGTTSVGGGTSGTLAISSSTGTKTFVGLVTVASSGTWNNSGNSAVFFRGGITNSGTFTAGSGVYTFDTNVQALTGTFTIPNVTVTGVTLTNNNTLSVSTALSGTGGLTQAVNSSLSIGGTSGLTTLTAANIGNTVDYNGTGAQTIRAINYYNLTISGARTTTSVTLVSSGTIGVAGAFSATATFTSGAYISTGSTVDLNGTTQTLSSFNNFNNLSVSGSGTKTVSGAVTINGDLTLTAGTLADGGNTITLAGNILGTGTHSGSGEISMTGTSKTISGATLKNLKLANGANFSLSGSPTIAGQLTLTTGTFNIDANNLTFGTSGFLNGPHSSSKMIIASGTGQVRKTFTANGSFTFPIGDNTGTVEYSPVTIAVTGSVYSAAYIGVSVVNAKHPNNSSTTNFLSRYWNITQSGITACTATITGTYLTADVTGAQTSIDGAQLNGTFDKSTNPWIKFIALGSNTLFASGATITAGQTSVFTGISNTVPTVSISSGGVTICNGATPFTLTATGTSSGVTGSFVYSWSPLTGLSSYIINNPTASPTSTTTYTVTARDANGIAATNTTTITVNPRPTSVISGTSSACGGTVSIALTGTPPWSLTYFDGTTSTPESGIVTSPYTFTASTITGATYTVTALSDSKCTSQAGDRTGSAIISANNPPTITTQPSQSVVSYCPNELATALTIVANGGSGTITGYQWYSNVTNANSGGTSIGGATSSSYIPSTATAGTLYYYCVVTTSTPCTVTSNTSGSITVDSSPSIIVQPSSFAQNVCQNDVATTLFITASGGNLAYEWYSRTIAFNSGGTLVAGANSSAFTPPTTALGTLYYYAIVSGSCIPDVPSSVSGAITVNAPPTITIQPSTASSIVCAGATGLSLSVTASGTGLTYQWYSNTSASNSGGLAISGATSSTVTTSTVSAGTLYYYCEVSSSNNCTSTSNVSGSVTVPLVIITQPTPTQALVVGSPASFTVVASSGSTFQWKKNGVDIVGATSATYTISSALSTDAGTYTVAVSNVACGVSITSNNANLVSAKPSVQSSSVLFSSITSSSLILNWTNGNGGNRIVVASAGSAVSQLPVDANSYSAAATIGAGGIEIASGSGNYVVYNGSGNTVTVTGLLPSVNYYFRVYEYSGTGTTTSYLTTTATNNPNNQSTRPSTPATVLTFTNVTPTGMTLNWSNGNGANRIVIAKSGSSPSTVPGDGTSYTANSVFGTPAAQVGVTGEYVVYKGTGNSVDVTGLTSGGTIYYYKVFEFAGANTTTTDVTVYLTTLPASNSQATLSTTGPTTQASNLVFSAITSSSLTLTWANGNGQNRMVVGRAGSAVNSNPVDANTYTANVAFSSGAQIGTGNYVVFNGSANTVTVTGLLPTTVYYFRVYEYNNSGSSTLYSTFTATNNPNNQSTKPSVQASGLTFTNISITNITANWTKGNGKGRIVVVTENASLNTTPTDGVLYTADTTFKSGSAIGNGYVVYNVIGSSTVDSVRIANLVDGTDYYFNVFEYSGTNSSASTTDVIQYLTSTATNNPSFATTPARNDYRSKASGDWQTIALWEVYSTKTDTWAAATKLPTKTNSIVIATGNFVTLSASSSFDQVLINGTLTINTGGTLTINANTRNSYNLGIGTNGKMEIEGTLTVADKAFWSTLLSPSINNMHFHSTGIYNHLYKATEGILPLATWDAGSTLNISGYNTSITATANGNWNQSFSDVTFSCPLAGSSTLDLGGLLTSIGGDLTISNTGNAGTGQILLYNGTASPTFSIGGNLNVSPTAANSALFVFNNSTGSPTLNIGGSVNVSGGSGTTVAPFSILTFNKAGSPVIKVGNSGAGSINVSGGSRFIVNTAGSPTINIPTDLSFTSTNSTGSSLSASGNPIINIDGSLTMSGSGGLLSFGSSTASGAVTVNLKKNFLFTAGTISNTSSNASNYGQVNFISGAGGTHTFSSPGTLSGKIHFSVPSSNILDVGTSAIAGTGDFTLASATTLRVGSTSTNGALQLGAAAGSNLQNTGTRTFANTSTIEFNGAGAQTIGTGFPSSASVNLLNSNSIGLSAPGGTLTLAGDLTNNGVFTHNNGTVAFASGTTIKEIKGSTKITFNNLTINAGTASPDVRLENTADVKGILDLTTTSTSTFDADGNLDNRVLTLLSSGDSPTIDASVAQMNSAGGQLLGKVTVQRYMAIEGGLNGNTRIYRYITSPLQNASVADIQLEIPVTGSFTGSSLCSGCNTNQSMFSYDETVQGTLNTGYIDFPATANTETLVPGVGYALFVRGDKLITSSALWDVRGTINSGTINLPVSRTGNTADDGWNLVGNPFASTIDWDASSGWTKTGIDNAIYIRDNGTNTFATYVNGIPAGGGSRYIATGQAFWVKASGSPTLSVGESAKVAGTQTTFFRESSPHNLVRIKISNGISNDEMVVYFNEGSTVNFDGHADAWKLMNTSLNLSSLLPDGKKLAINSLPRLDCNQEVKLALDNVIAGNYKLNFSEFESFSDTVSIRFKDNFMNTEFDIRSATSYSFAVTSDLDSYGAGRFVVIFHAPEINTAFAASASDICMGTNAQITLANSSRDVIYQALLPDGTIVNSALGNGSVLQLTVPNEVLTAGTNSITIKSISAYCSVTTTQAIVEFNVEKIPVLSTVINGKRCKEGVVTLTAANSPSGNYNWYESETAEVAIADQHAATLVTPTLTKSKTYFVSLVNSLGCEGERAQVLAEVVLYDEVKITSQQKELTSSYLFGNQWYFNDQIIVGAIGQSYKATRAGTYKVEVEINGCYSSDQVILPNSAIKPDATKELTAYPNPFGSLLTVTVANSESQVILFKITDMTGRPLIVKGSEVSADGVYTINTESLGSGIYILEIKIGHAVHNLKLQKE